MGIFVDSDLVVRKQLMKMQLVTSFPVHGGL
jgi:hypothetical protein